jgi:hypothetical protein
MSTLSIPLDKSWNNATLDMATIDRPFPGLEYECLWLDDFRNIVYTFGGKLTADGREVGANSFYMNRSMPQSLWGLRMDAQPRAWARTLGPGAGDYPKILQTSSGACTSDRKRGYHIGGAISSWSTPAAGKDPSLRNIPGFITFDFDTLEFHNSSNDGEYFASDYTQENQTYRLPGSGFQIPFGPEGLEIFIGGQMGHGGSENARGAGWEYMTVFNPATEKFFQQQTTGDIPTFTARWHPYDWSTNQHCTFVAIDEKLKSVEL